MKKLVLMLFVAVLVGGESWACGYNEKFLAECAFISDKVSTEQIDKVIIAALPNRLTLTKEEVSVFIRTVLSPGEKMKESKEYVPIREIHIDKLPIEIAAWIDEGFAALLNNRTWIGGIDLDGDGKLEWIFEDALGGSMGPSYMVITRKNGQWKPVETFTGGWVPIKVEGKKGLGLFAVIRNGGSAYGCEYYKYDSGKWKLLMLCSVEKRFRHKEDTLVHHFEFYEIMEPVVPGSYITDWNSEMESYSNRVFQIKAERKQKGISY